MDADRVNIFHITNGDTIAVAVSHHFVFDFLPPANITLDQYLTDTT